MGVGGVDEPVGDEGGGGAVAALLPEARVQVVEELVAGLDGDAAGLGGGGPAVELVVDCADGLVHAEEGHEGAEHGPARAEGFGGVVRVAADVGTHHWELVDGGEGDGLRDGDQVVGPGCVVVAEPVADFGPGACEGASGDYEGTNGGTAVKHGAVAGDGHHVPVEVVRVVLHQSIRVHQVGIQCLVRDGPSGIVDLIWRID